MIDKPDTIAFWRGRLPHWEVANGRYFLTVHLAGAIPAVAGERIHALAAQLDDAQRDDVHLQLQRRIFREMEQALHADRTVAHLREPSVAAVVVDAVARRQADGTWEVFEFVVMPNHVHLFFRLGRGPARLAGPTGGTGFAVAGGLRLKPVLTQFKRWTAHEAAKSLQMSQGRFWQKEWFDHWSRSAEQDERIKRYIRENPVKAGLADRYRDWPCGSWAVQ